MCPSAILFTIEEPHITASDNFETLTERFLRKARGTAKGVSVDGVSNALIIFEKAKKKFQI